MIAFTHPSDFLPQKPVQVIRSVSFESEQMKQLHQAQLEMVHSQKWFQLFVPKKYNGLELSLPKALRLEEGLAWADGSVGWTVTLCAGAGWFIGFLESGIVDAIFNGRKVCVAGSGKTTGIAKIMADGYEITGYWDYATGAAHATAFTANCFIEERGVITLDVDGSRLVQSFIFLRDEVIVHDNWSSMGMIATGSHSFEVKRLLVKKNRSFVIDGRYAILRDPIFQFPFLQLAETTLAVNHSGMAVRFLDLCSVWFKEGGTKAMMLLLLKSRDQLNEARQEFYSVVNESWEACLYYRTVSPSLLESITRTSRNLALTARKVADELYPCCGLKASDPSIEINRVWRNLHTASQHSLLNGYRRG